MDLAPYKLLGHTETSQSKKMFGAKCIDDLPKSAHISSETGRFDGEKVLISEDDSAVVLYEWNEPEKKWVKVGAVLCEQDRPLLDGSPYDYVFDIQIGDRVEKLPYNRSDDPSQVAHAWLQKMEGNLDHTQMIVDLILEGSGQKTVGFIPFPFSDRKVELTVPLAIELAKLTEAASPLVRNSMYTDPIRKALEREFSRLEKEIASVWEVPTEKKTSTRFEWTTEMNTAFDEAIQTLPYKKQTAANVCALMQPNFPGLLNKHLKDRVPRWHKKHPQIPQIPVNLQFSDDDHDPASPRRLEGPQNGSDAEDTTSPKH